MRVRCARVHSHGLFKLCCSTYCGLGAFNVVGGHCVLPCQDALMMWYVTIEPCYVSVLRIGACDPGGAEWSRRCCTGPAFGRVSISPSTYGHLTLAITSRSSPHGTGIPIYLVHPWAYKYRSSFRLKCSWL